MALQKMVRGVNVDCSPEEEAAIRAEWEANAAKPKPSANDRLESRLRRDPLMSALVDELAEAKGLERAALVSRLAGKVE